MSKGPWKKYKSKEQKKYARKLKNRRAVKKYAKKKKSLEMKRGREAEYRLKKKEKNLKKKKEADVARWVVYKKKHYTGLRAFPIP